MVESGELKYLHGFGNHFETEALEGALPQYRNAPQKCAYGLYAEQLSGTPFTYPRHKNQRSWTYRIRPTVGHPSMKDSPDHETWITNYDRDDKRLHITPNQFRWKPIAFPAEGKKQTFVQGIISMMGAGSPALKTGIAIHYYACNANMEKEAFYNSDGDMLIVPQEGPLLVKTEMG